MGVESWQSVANLPAAGVPPIELAAAGHGSLQPRRVGDGLYLSVQNWLNASDSGLASGAS